MTRENQISLLNEIIETAEELRILLNMGGLNLQEEETIRALADTLTRTAARLQVVIGGPTIPADKIRTPGSIPH